MSEWTDELKAEVIEQYENAEPTAENSAEIVADIASKIGKTPNGVRMILVKAGKYIKKTPDSSSPKSTTSGGRLSKEAAQTRLREAISSAGAEVDDAIISKLTGKASKYLAEVIESLT